MPGYWLCKSEPDVYSIDDLRRDTVTGWEGVRNYQARNFMRDGMQPGDRVLVYHSNAEPTGVAGIAEVAGAAKADPTQFDPRSEYHDPKSTREAPRWVMRELRFVERFARVVTLDELKGCKALGAMAALQKGNRLSVTPVTKAEFDAVVRMAKGLPATPAAASRK
jgi:predicted RNA-binding protein with PUA-like domain